MQNHTPEAFGYLPITRIDVSLFFHPFVCRYERTNPAAVERDSYGRTPGTQSGQITLECPNRRLNCFADHNHKVESGIDWQSSMMTVAPAISCPGPAYLSWAGSV